MAYSKTIDAATQDTQAQIAALRQQVNQLLGDRVQPVISDYADRARSAASQATSYTQDQADMVAEQVRGRPLAAVALAGAIGYILGRFIR